MITFKGEPNLTVRFNPPIGLIKHVKFDENGEFTTDNERVIQRFKHKYDSVPFREYRCKECTFTTDNKPDLMTHYRIDPKDENKDNILSKIFNRKHPKGAKK